MPLSPIDLAENLWMTSPARMAERLVPKQFVRYRHIDYLDRVLRDGVFTKNARVGISMPPRHGKSWLTSIFLPAWFLMLFPEKNVILTSYEAAFAASWGRRVRNFLQEHAATLGIQISQDSTAADRFHTSRGGGMITAGVGGAITGRGGDLILVDDPIKNWEEAYSETYRAKIIDWWNSTLYTRAEPGASIVVLQTRWHEGDLLGYLLSPANETHQSWQSVSLPAIAEEGDPLGRKVGEALCPERYDAAALQSIRQSVGSRAWASLYQQRPAAAEGNIIKREWMRQWTNIPPRWDELIISVDATFSGKATSDFVAMGVWGRVGAQKYLLDLVYKQMGITDTIEALVSLSAKWPEARLKLIENKANGPAIEDLLKRHMSGIVLWEPTGDKIARMNAVAPQFEAGNVLFPLHVTHPWVQDLMDEIATFPNSIHDDRSDMLTQALLRLEESVSRGVGVMRVVRR